MALKFHDIFTGGAGWTIESKHQGFVENVAADPAQDPQASLSWFGKASPEPPPHRMRKRSADSDDAHRRRGAAARKCKDGVRAHERALVGAPASINPRQANILPRP